MAVDQEYQTTESETVDKGAGGGGDCCINLGQIIVAEALSSTH